MNKVYEIVTDKIIEQMEKGVIPWHQSWFGKDTCISHDSGKEYSFLNQMLLGEAGEYLTFNQVKKQGGSVKKGSHSKIVVFWKMMLEKMVDEDGKPVLDDNGEEKCKMRPILRYYKVFNVKDCEGIEPKYTRANKDNKPIDEAEKIANDYLKRESIDVKDSDIAAYNPKGDYIEMPMLEQFESDAEYYSTFFHEIIHSTGAKKRLDRINIETHFNRDNYGKEELVAELGSAFIMNTLGIEGAFDNSVAYLDSWLKQIKGNPTLIVNAAAQAEKAVNYMQGAE